MWMSSCSSGEVRATSASSSGSMVSATSCGAPMRRLPSSLPLAQAAQGLVVQREQVVRVAQQALAVLGQALLAALLGKERMADLLFEPLHLLRDGRLRALQVHGRGGKAAVADNGREGAQQFKVEGGHTLILLMCFLRRLDCGVMPPSLQ
jgi:hypothetical protein